MNEDFFGHILDLYFIYNTQCNVSPISVCYHLANVIPISVCLSVTGICKKQTENHKEGQNWS